MTHALCKPCAEAVGPIMARMDNGPDHGKAFDEFREFKLCADCQKRYEDLIATVEQDVRDRYRFQR
jgi:hypothetical protein